MNVLLNNAGVSRPGWWEDVSPADAEVTIDTNLRGVVHGISAALPLLKNTPGARIVNVSSAAGVYGTPTAAVYSASKAAVLSLSEALDLEFERYGIRVTAVLPGMVDTPLARAAVAKMPPEEARQVSFEPPHRAAETIWDAAHGTDTYYFVGDDARALWHAPHAARDQVSARMRAMLERR